MLSPMDWNALVWSRCRYGIQVIGYVVLEFLGVWTTFDVFQNTLFQYSLNTAYCLSWIRRIGLVSFVVFGECGHGYAVSSLIDTAYCIPGFMKILANGFHYLKSSLSPLFNLGISFLSPRIRPLSPRALRAEMNAIASSLYHSLHTSGTPPLLPIPLSTPSTGRRAGIPEADTLARNRPLLATPRPGCEVSESSAAVARRPGPTMAHGVDCSYVETRLRDTERRMMAALELVNLRDRATMRAEIEVLSSERLAYEQEGIQTREALARSKAYCRALEARITVLETHACRLEWQRQVVDDFAVQHIMRTQAFEAGAHDDTLEDT
nr:hypothetical protein [Tanacetum cinerariifolium]